MGYDGIVDALLPFVPPFMRVNAQTLEEIKQLVPSVAQVQSLLSWKTAKLAFYVGLWMYGLVWSGRLDLVTLYMIATLFCLIMFNLGDSEKDSVTVDEDGNVIKLPSAYSVFNSKNQRLAGQLTTEHFEQQIRNQPNMHDSDEERPFRDDDYGRGDDEDDDDEDLREAIRRSLADASGSAGAGASRRKGNQRRR